ncbi:MAG TPA: YetF domain-containing protein [Terracidiphilus sp.]|nr:YetF domain-containing protein [Terracidiphilus sp.]
MAQLSKAEFQPQSQCTKSASVHPAASFDRVKCGWRKSIEIAILIPMQHSLVFEHMFQLPLPILEKLARPVIVYLVLVVLLRLFGKRELAQLNPFDLVVLLSLSNTVQNAIIGDDNSITGGVIGAVGLLGINWLVVRTLFRSKRLTRMLEGHATVLVHNGRVDLKALEHESLTREELIEVIHRQGFESVDQVRKCELEPNGTFYVEAYEPSVADKRHAELLQRLDALNREVAELRGNA